MRLDSKKRYVTWFFILVFLIPLAIILSLLIGPQTYGMERLNEIFEKLEEAEALHGITLRGTAFLPFVRISLKEPVLWLMSVVVAAPSLAALILTLRYFGWAGVHQLLSRLAPWRNNVSTREGVIRWGVLIGTMVSLMLSQFVLARALGLDPEFTWGMDLSFAMFGWFFVSAMFLDQGGLLEELGWRGYAAPILQERMLSPLKAAILIGLIWALWHVPLQLADVASLKAFLFQQVVFITSTISLAIIIQYFSNGLGGSVLAAMAVHGLSNDSIGIGGTSYDMSDPLAVLTRGAPLFAAALVVLTLSGCRLGYRKLPTD